GLVEELLEVVLGPLGLGVTLRLGGGDDLVEEAGGLGGHRRAGGLGLFERTHYLGSSVLGVLVSVPGAGRPISLASDMAFSVLPSTSPSSCSSLSLPSILVISWVSRWRMSSSSRRAGICWATLAGSKSSMFWKFNSTASLLLASVSLFCTFMASRGAARLSTSLKLSRSIGTNFRSLSGRSDSLGCADRSAMTPTTKGSSVLTMAPLVSTSYVICTRGRRTRSSLCCRLSLPMIVLPLGTVPAVRKS